jgi:hypothetical protein
MSSKIGGKSKKKRKMVAAFANAPEAEKKKIQKVSVLSETTLASIADGPQQKAQDELVIALPGASKKKKWCEKSPHGGESREGDKNGVGGGRDGTGEDEDDSMNIPLLARARTGMDMSGDGKLKGVEDVGEDAYERVSVESYGAAMLRGMGWSKGGSIGSTFSTVTEVSLAQPRAARMGLGADSELPTDGLGGVLSEENKALAKKKADKAAASAAMRKAKKEAEGKMTQGLNLFGAKPVPLDKTFLLSKPKPPPSSSSSSSSSATSSSSSSSSSWVRPGLVVRVTDRDHDLYRQNCLVVNASSSTGKWKLRPENKSGAEVRRLKVSQFQTVVPRVGGAVLIVRGGQGYSSYVGRSGVLVERDERGKTAIVTLTDGKQTVTVTSMNHICKLS